MSYFLLLLFSDRFRTMINVWGDSVVCGIVAHLSKTEIAENEKRMREKAQKELESSGKNNEGFEMETKTKQRHDDTSSQVDAKF